MRVYARQGGFVLVSVLAVVLALSTVALYLIRDQTRLAGRVGVMRAATGGEMRGDAALLLAQDLLMGDLRANEIDHPGEIWVLSGREIAVGQGRVKVRLTDLDARLNLNLLLGDGGQSAADVVERLAAISRAPDGLSDALISVVGSRGSPGVPVTEPAQPEAFRPGDLTHLLLLEGTPDWSDPAAQTFRESVTTLPRARGVNVNSASREVLRALTGLAADDVETLLLSQQEEPFGSVEAFRNRLAMIAGAEATARMPAAMMSVTSHWFELTTESHSDGLVFWRQSILYRDPKSGVTQVFARNQRVWGE